MTDQRYDPRDFTGAFDLSEWEAINRDAELSGRVHPEGLRRVLAHQHRTAAGTDTSSRKGRNA